MAGDEDDFGTVIFPKGKAPGQKTDPPQRRPEQKTFHGLPAVPPPPLTTPPAPPAPPPKSALPTMMMPAFVAPKPPKAEPPPAAEPAEPPPPPPRLPDPVGPSGLAVVKATRAVDLCEPIPLDPAALKLLDKDHTPRQYLDALVGAELFADAIRFLAHILPKREAIWWAHQCLIGMDRKASALVLQVVEQWVSAPAEESRRAAQPAAQMAGPATPSGLAALAVFWSGGSIGPPDGAPVQPGPTQSAGGVALAVICVALADASRIQERYWQALIQGVEIGNGQRRWKGM